MNSLINTLIKIQRPILLERFGNDEFLFNNHVQQLKVIYSNCSESDLKELYQICKKRISKSK